LVLAGALLVALAPSARADEPPPAATPTPVDTSIECPRCHPEHWTSEPYRPFFSLTAVVGYLYLKPRFSFGYGRPYALWGGIDVTPIGTTSYVGGYSGLHLQVPYFDFRAGARAVHAFEHQLLPQQPSYTLVDLAEIIGRPANYLSLEAEISGAIPAGPGDILVLATAESIQLVPAGYDVYDETLHVIVSPPPVYRGRLGYAARFLQERNLQVGVVGEVIEIPGRQAQVYRAGVVATFDIDDHLQAVGLLVVPVLGPDSLGLAGADYTELGIRYRWATGHEHPPQEVIPPEEESAMGR
jgi:hypothetical protein